LRGPIEVKAVEKLWMIGAFPVDGWTAQIFLLFGNRAAARCLCAFAIRFA
jgi:hypothetical protein